MPVPFGGKIILEEEPVMRKKKIAPRSRVPNLYSMCLKEIGTGREERKEAMEVRRGRMGRAKENGEGLQGRMREDEGGRERMREDEGRRGKTREDEGRRGKTREDEGRRGRDEGGRDEGGRGRTKQDEGERGRTNFLNF
jgi:hypothetical protein